MILMVVFSVVLAVALYSVMPEKMVTHWGLYGQPDGWMGKFWGLAMFPLINTLMLLMFVLVPLIEPKKENISKFRSDYDRLIVWISMILNYIFILSVFYNLGIIFDMGRWVMPGIGALYVGIGSVLPRAKQNYSVGIRTPWTLASDSVWKKTHELGGKLFVVSGLATVLAIFLPVEWGFAVTIGSVILATLAVMFYSWREYEAELRK